MKKIKKNEKRITGKVKYLNDAGAGIVISGKEKIPVPFLLKNEVAEIDVVQYGKHYQTSIHKLIETSKDRIKPACRYYGECGGCQLMHMTYPAQLTFKTNYVENLFKRKTEIIGMTTPYAYRNKGIFSFKGTKKIQSGFYKMYSHDIVSIKECMVQDELMNPIMETIDQLVNQFKLKVYNEDNKTGFLRHVLIRTGFYSKEVMVAFVVTNKIFPGKNQFVKALTKKHPEIKTVIQNINNRSTSVVLGDTEILLYGNGMIKDELCGLTFHFSSKAFYQINPMQTEKLYHSALEMAKLKRNDIVIDTYSGIGTISLIAAKKVKKVFGIEINRSAIKNSVKNAKINNINNAQFIQGDASDVMVQMAKEKVPVNTVFMDPPREGSNEKFLSSVVKLKPEQVIYISCNPTTQKRDVDYLLKKGYKIKDLKVFDLFPMTGHAETICQLVLK